MRRLGVFILWLLWRLLPSRAIGWVGARLGDGLHAFAYERRRIADINLRLCFPEWPDAERQQVVRKHFRALGRAALRPSLQSDVFAQILQLRNG